MGEITDVVIVGAGPVGLIAALDLSKRGISTIVIEEKDYLDPPGVKSNHVSARTMERFRRLGLADAVRDAGLPSDHPHDVSFRTTLTGHELGRIAIPSRRDRFSSTEGPDTSWRTPEPPHRVNQSFLEPILKRHAVRAPYVTLINSTRFESYTQDDSGLQVQVLDLRRDERRCISGRFLIGADGASSAVRKQMGASLRGDAVLQHVQSTCIRAPGLYERMSGDRAWAYYTFNPRRNGHVYSVDGDEVFLIHTYLNADEAQTGSVDRDWAIRTILGVDDSFKYEVVSKEDWIARRLVANRFRQDRVFLAGDSSHLWVPYAGYGMNAGIADALNLTWLLGAYLKGWAPYTILNAYELERPAITEQVSLLVMEHQKKLSKESIPPEIEEQSDAGDQCRRDVARYAYTLNEPQFAAAGLNFGYSYDTSPIIEYDGSHPPEFAMGDYTPSTVPGCRAPHFWLPDGRSVYDAFGPFYTLICIDGDAGIRSLVSAAASLNFPLEVVRVPRDATPPEYTHRLTLCREDQHVAWRGDCVPDDVEGLLKRLTGYEGLPTGEGYK